MKKSVKYGWLVASIGAALFIGGCSSTYYKVTDPHSGTAYYTEKVDTLMGTGAVKVKDARTGSIVTLQSSEVKEISEKEYKDGIAAPAIPPAPAPVAVPAAVPAPVPEPVPTAAPSDAPAATAPSAEPTPAPGGTN